MAKDTNFRVKCSRKAGYRASASGYGHIFRFSQEVRFVFPSGGTDLGEKLKDQSVQNITAVHELVERLSQAKDFEEALRTQTAFMHSQLNALGKHRVDCKRGTEDGHS